MRAMARVVAWLFFLLGGSLAVSQTVDTEPRVKRIVNVEYPRIGRFAAIQGDVELVASISEDGAVKGIRKVSGSDILASPATEALSQWLFTGCKGAGSACEIKILFRFVLLKGTCDDSGNSPIQFEADLPDHVTIKARPRCAIVN